MTSYEDALALTKRLARTLGHDDAPLRRLDDYYQGKHPLAFATDKFRNAFGGLFTEFADNWAPLVVDAVRQRLHVEGFRFGETSGDTAAWQVWQENYLDADSDILHTDAMVYGRSYVSVAPGENGGVSISVESPASMVVLMSGATRRRRLAALRRFRDDDGRHAATLYLPDETWRWKQRGSSLTFGGTWEPRDATQPEKNLLGVVPVVPFLNRPRLDPWGYSELAQVIPLQDAVNKLVSDMLVASEYTAMPQRYATGIEVDRDPVTNQPKDPFPPLARTWTAEAPDVKFGQFTAADLSNYVQAIEMLIQHVASQSATPPHYFYLRGQFPSGESIKSAEAGLVAKSYDRMRSFGESWEEVMRLAFRVLGDPRAGLMTAETIWADPEVRTESQHVDAVVKKQTLGVPTEQLWEDLGYTPEQRRRFGEMALGQDMRNARAQAVALGLGNPVESPPVP